MQIFDRLRDAPEKPGDRSDLVSGLAFAAGLAAALAWSGDELRELDAVDSIIWAFVTGTAFGFAIYWIVGWALWFVVRRLGGTGTSRRARHVLAYSFAPLTLALIVWLIYPPLLLVLAAASLALLVVGLREVYGWDTERAIGAVALSAVWLAALGVTLLSVLRLLRRLGE